MPEPSESKSPPTQPPPSAPLGTPPTFSHSGVPGLDLLPPAPVQQIGPYPILTEIARGGMGAIYRVHDAHLGRDLAVKLLLYQYAGRADLIRRFCEEAQITGQLQHPGIVPIHALGRLPDGRPYFTMKLIQGRTLAELLRERPGPQSDLPAWLKVFEQVCQTLAYAHSKGVIHRDLKPLNIMVGGFGEVQVMDWGLAKVLPGSPLATSTPTTAVPHVAGSPHDSTLLCPAPAGSGLLTQAGAVMGTPAYMAPEQARGEIEQVDERADVFGLGAILCTILTGEPPFTGKTHEEVLERARQGNLDDARTRLDRCGADPDLIVLARHCLTADREARPRNASAVAEAMTAHLASVQARLHAAEIRRAEALALAAGERTARRLAEQKRRMTIALAAATLALVILGAASWAWISQQNAVRAREHAERAAAQAQLEAEARLAYEKAVGLRQQARHAPAGDLSLWTAALKAANLARGMLGEHEVDPDLRRDILALSAALEEEEGDRRMLARLEDARLQMTVVKQRGFAFERKRLADACALAFRDYGIDVLKLEPTEAARRIARRSICVPLAGALDFWAAELGHTDPAPRLRAIACAADPDPWRNRLREQASRPKMDVRTLEELAATVDPARLPVTSLLLLADALAQVEAVVPSIHLLRRAQLHYPDDFWVNFNLSTRILQGDTARLDEALRYLSVARALRPANANVELFHVILLQQVGHLDEARVAFERARRLQPNSAMVELLAPYFNTQPGATAGVNKRLQEILGQFNDPLMREVLEAMATGKTPSHDLLVRAAQSLCRENPRSFLVHLWAGRELLSRGSFAEALPYLRKAVQLDTFSAEAHALCGSALRLLGRHEEAIPELRQAVTLQKGYAWALGELGAALRGQGNLDEAEKVVREALHSHKGYAWAHAELGMLLQQKGHKKESEQAFRTALRLEPTLVYALRGLSDQLLRQGKHREALTLVDAALKRSADNPELHALRGTLLLISDPERAAHSFENALKRRNNLAEAHFGLGQLRLSAGRIPDAVVHLEQAVRLAPEQALYALTLGTALIQAGKQRQGAATLRQALERQPDSLPFQDASLTALRQAVRDQPKDETAHFDLGLLSWNLGLFDETVAAYREVIRLSPANAAAHYNLGNVLLDRGSPEEAVPAFEAALRHGFLDAYHNHVTALLHTDRIVDAIAVLQRGMVAFKDNAAQRSRLDRRRADIRRWEAAGEKVPALLGGKRTGLSEREQIELAWVCFHRGYHRRSADLLAAVFRTAPRQAEAPSSLQMSYGRETNRFLAACAAVRAGRGQDREERGLDDEDRARYLRLAREWLQAEWTSWQNRLRSGTPAERGRVQQRLRIWLCSGYLAGVRGAELVHLPAEERTAWRTLWAEVIESAWTPSGWPDTADGSDHWRLVNLLRQHGLVPEGLAAVRRALRRFPTEAVLHGQLGLLLQSQNRTAEAIDAYRLALKYHPDAPATHWALASLLLATGQYEASLTSFQKAMARADLAGNWRNGMRYQAACAAVMMAASLPVESTRAVALRGQALAWLQQDLKAMLARGNPAGQVDLWLDSWLKQPELASVREPASMGRLPEKERASWQALWKEVAQRRRKPAS